MLCEAIIEMAINDIRKDNIHAKDAIEFMKSPYVDCYLQIMGSKLTGREILRILEEEKNNGRVTV